MNHTCVDKHDPPVRTIEDVNRDLAAHAARLQAQISPLFRAPMKRCTKPVFADTGERWNSMRDFALQFGVDPGTGYQYISKGVRFKGRKLSYVAFSYKQLQGGRRKGAAS
jgi:hypothetical protein